MATKNFIKQFSKKPIFDVALSIKIVMGFHSYLNQYYYNKKYPYSRKQRNQEIKELLMSQYYSEALYKVDVKYLLRKEKVLFYFLKSQNTFMIRVLFFAEHTLRKLKRGNLKNEIK